MRCSVDFVANVEATCTQSGAFRGDYGNTFFNFPCTDFAGYLKGKDGFTATIVSIEPYSPSKNQKAHITLSGASSSLC
jgi:hypothetical protein